MCARFFLTPSLDEILAVLGVIVDDAEDSGPLWNVAPTDVVPVVRRRKGRNELTSMRWGLVPTWWRDDKLPVFVNARAESVADKPSFKHALASRRALVPVSGFYEWTTRDGQKIPHAIRVPGEAVTVFAGVWEDSPRVPRPTCAVLTTDATGAMRAVHDRQPLVLPRPVWDRWLDPTVGVDGIRDLLVPYAAPWEVVEVGRGVSDVRDKAGGWFSP